MAQKNTRKTMVSWLLLLVSNLIACNTDAFCMKAASGFREARQLLLSAVSDRREVMTQLMGIGVTLAWMPPPSSAGEIGSRITQAITTSDLGVSVRRSVVKGAQTMDTLDKQWEGFSDRFSLGSERSKQGGRPKPKVIPPLLPLDRDVSNRILDTCDAVFSDVTGISNSAVKGEIDKVSALVKPSFQRSGADLKTFDTIVESSDQFNFASYVHFKAFGNLLVEKKIDFRKFRREFERQCGTKLLTLLNLDPNITPSSNRTEDLSVRLQALDSLTRILHDKGLVASTELSTIDPDLESDWAEGLSDLQLSLALDGDATQNAQILLQEQGFNLIPSYTKFMLGPLLRMPGQKLLIEEYYMDTDYNSNPDLFDVKEVLLNIVLESQ